MPDIHKDVINYLKNILVSANRTDVNVFIINPKRKISLPCVLVEVTGGEVRHSINSSGWLSWADINIHVCSTDNADKIDLKEIILDGIKNNHLNISSSIFYIIPENEGFDLSQPEDNFFRWVIPVKIFYSR